VLRNIGPALLEEVVIVLVLPSLLGWGSFCHSRRMAQHCLESNMSFVKH
jgi:hypothetical protein